MISLANPRRIIAAAERKAKVTSQRTNIAAVDGGGNFVAPLRIARGQTNRLIGACLALLAGSALLGQQSQFQGSVPAGTASPTPVSLTLRDAIDRGLRTNLG